MGQHRLDKRQLDVLLISRSYPPFAGGGVATHTQYLAEALTSLETNRRICRVHVLTTYPGQRVAVEGTPPNLTIHCLPGVNGHFRSDGAVPCESAIDYCLQKWHDIDADIVHAHDFEGAFIGLMCKTAFSIPLLLTVHKTPKEWDPSSKRRDVKNCFLEALRTFGLADRVVAPSEAYKSALIDQGFREDRIALIPHGVPMQRLAAAAARPGVFERMEIDPTHELVLCPVRLDPHKAPETFIDAATIIASEFPHRNLLFVIAGAGSRSYRERLLARVTDAGLAHRFRLGPQDGRDLLHDEMPTLYRRAILSVFPSRREGSAQALFEAAVFNSPIVAANTGGIRDFVRPLQNGLLFNRDEPEDLARQVAVLLRDSAFGTFIARNAHEDVRKRFDSSTMATNYLKLYKELTGIRIQK